MGLFDLMASVKSEPVRMAPFIAPDISEKTDRELLEMMTLSMLKTEHTINQVMLTAQSSPLLASMIPRP